MSAHGKGEVFSFGGRRGAHGARTVRRCEDCGRCDPPAGDSSVHECGACGGTVRVQPPPVYSVTFYLTDRAYGGPEEGGWYFDTAEPIPGRRVWMTECEDTAHRIAGRLNAFIRATGANGDRRPVHSVLSEGELRAEVCEGLPHSMPERRPFYS